TCPRTTPAPKLRNNSAPYSILVRTPACWISIWLCICDGASTPTTKLISSVAVGLSVPPPATPSPSFTIPKPSSGSCPSHPNPHKIVGPKSWENTPSNPVSFCSPNKSHFELPPTETKCFIALLPELSQYYTKLV